MRSTPAGLTARLSQLTRSYCQAEFAVRGAEEELEYAAWITAQRLAAQREKDQLEDQLALATIQLVLSR